jgi:alkylation response protein AidB-like acyl-CoA dehydrogenase
VAENRPVVDPLSLAEELAAEFAVGAGQRDRAGGLPERNLALARERGLPALTVPRELGGWGADLATFARYQERIARGDGATALILAMHHMLIGGEAESGLWPKAAWEAVCEAAVARGALGNSAASEPGAGSPSLGGLPSTRAERSADAGPGAARPGPGGGAAIPGPDGGWRLTGVKAWVTGAPALGFLRVSARVEEPGREPSSARFLVWAGAPGMRIGEGWDPVALRASASEEVGFDQTPATFLYPEDARGCEGNVWFQVAIAATYLGIGQAAYECARDHVRRHAPAGLGRPLAQLEAVRLRVGRLRGLLMVARRNLFATCDEWAGTPPQRRPELVTAVSLAKVTAVGAAVEAAEGAARLAGGAAMYRDLPLERHLREVRAGLSHPPVDDVAHLSLAAEELDSP